MTSGRSKEELQGVSLLGNKTAYKSDYAPEVLESFPNKHPQNDYWVKFNCPEFTSLCPMTGQPDFATIYISYVPDERLVESKSLKLYLFSFRNHGDFHEDCVNIIMKDLIKLMEPKYIEVWGKFLPRGGLSIDPYATTASREPNGSRLQRSVFSCMICIPKQLITDKKNLSCCVMRQLFFCSRRRTQRIKTIFRQLKLAAANQRLVLTNFFR